MTALLRYSLLAGLCLIAIGSFARTAYSSKDSARAKEYFSQSWRYSLGSDKHQLYLDSALMVIPTHSYYWQQKAMPLYKAFKFELGRPFLDSAVKYDPDRWLDYAGFMKCIFSREYRDALTDFHRAMALYGNRSVMDHPYGFYIGLCHLQLGGLDSCEYYFKACIENTGKTQGEEWVHYNHLFYLGVLYYQKTNYTLAIEYFDKALKLYPDFSDAQYYKAICFDELNRKGDALLWMEKAWKNHSEGYSMNEDNDRYEFYPYQVRKFYLLSALNAFRKEAKKEAEK